MTCACIPNGQRPLWQSVIRSRSSMSGMLFVALALGAPGCVAAQTYKADLAVTFDGERSVKANTQQDFWLTGGSLELGTKLYKGIGVALNVTGSTADSIGSSGIPLSLVTVTVGPRYRWHSDHRLSVYGEGLVGEADGFRSFFPTAAGGTSSSNSLAVQVGGGLDYRPLKRFSVRLLDASWVRTQLPNATDTQQNILRLGAGLVLRFGH